MASKREELQNELADYINRQPYSAPYGVIERIRPVSGGGKVRTITFGVARTLDAELLIFSETNFVLRLQGALSYKFQTKYTSLEDLKRDLYEAVN